MNINNAVPPQKISKEILSVRLPEVPNCIVCPATIRSIAKPLNTLI
jgi:hypothetical protein